MDAELAPISTPLWYLLDQRFTISCGTVATLAGGQAGRVSQPAHPVELAHSSRMRGGHLDREAPSNSTIHALRRP